MMNDDIRLDYPDAYLKEPRNRIKPPEDLGAMPDTTAYFDEVLLKSMRLLDNALDRSAWDAAVYLAKIVSRLMEVEERE